MRSLILAAIAAVGLTLASPSAVSAQYRVYDPNTGSVTTYYYIPGQVPLENQWVDPRYLGGPPRSFGPRNTYSYNPAFQSRTNRGFFTPYRSDYGSFFSPYRSDYSSAFSPYYGLTYNP